MLQSMEFIMEYNTLVLILVYLPYSYELYGGHGHIISREYCCSFVSNCGLKKKSVPEIT